jgi:UDP-N-acetylglucosamine 2-epimerase (non-hydrolysing)
VTIDVIAGARPNFVKIAPLIHALNNASLNTNGISFRLVHTGQHYDKLMSDSFFNDLNIPHPDINLNCNGGTQAEQTAAIMIAYEKVLLQGKVDLVVVVGDVTSTMACAIVAKKLNIKVAHIEAGIRSFDLSMPEEINRMVTDSISDYFFTTGYFANSNLKKAGVSEEKIFFVGNIMVDTLLANQSKLQKPGIFKSADLKIKKYFVLTLHRPSNVDTKSKLIKLLSTICINCNQIPIIFPVHPRTLKILKNASLPQNLILTDPLGYLEFNYLVKNSKGVITDSGGITEETTIMKIPCITIRNNTERPETVELGSNVLAGDDGNDIVTYIDKIIKDEWKKSSIPDLWDGKTAERIVQQLQTICFE